ncbi:MAG: hypothetical protein RBR53_08530 [Desulforegulaceae bacterium]|nr:hypothetical protein [Desulforegulaceae bacterium]
MKKIFFIFISIFFLGCATDHHVLKEYQFVRMHDNLIAGIEPEEAVTKILITEIGKGVAPQNGTPMEQKYMAERAAVLDGYRRLSERLAGLIIQANSEAGNGSLDKDQIVVVAKSYMRGANVEEVTYQEGLATAEIKLYIKPRKEVYYNSLFSGRK